MNLLELQMKLDSILPGCKIDTEEYDQITIWTDHYVNPETQQIEEDNREVSFFFVRAMSDTELKERMDEQASHQTPEKT